jgi:hypothetical protein
MEIIVCLQGGRGTTEHENIAARQDIQATT